MSDFEMESRLRGAAAGLPVPQPSDHQLQRILRRREAGERVRLPDPARTVNHFSRFTRWLTVAAAMALIGGIADRGVFHGPDRSPDSSGGNRTPKLVATSGMADALGLWPGELQAQASMDSSDDVPPLRNLDGSRVRPGVWVYRRIPTNGIAGRPQRLDSIAIRAVRFQSIQAWETTTSWSFESNGAGLVPARDTVWIRQTDLFPLGRTSLLTSGYRRAVTYSEDSVIAVFDSEGEVRRIAAPAPSTDRGTALAGPGGLLPLFQLVPLTFDWKGSIRAVGINDDGETVDFRIRLRVTGRETVTVPAGTFDCWRVVLGEGSDYSYWVSRDNHWIVQEGTPSFALRILLSYNPLPN